MKEVTKKEMDALIENKMVRNTIKGFVDQKGMVVGFYRTRHKRYIEDKYVDIAKKLI